MTELANDGHHPKALCQALVENSPIPTITFDSGGIISIWNSAAEALFGYSSEEVIGQPIADLIRRRDISGAEAVDLVEMINQGGRIQFPAVHSRKSQPPIKIDFNGAPIIEGEETVGYLAMYSEIPELKRISDEISSQKEYLEALFQNSPTAVVTVDLKGNVVSWNPVAESLFGYSRNEVIGGNIDDLLANHPTIREQAVSNTQQVLQLGRIHMTTKRTHKNGSLIDVELLAVPVVVSDEIVGFIAIYHDIRHLMQVERELRRQKEYYEALFINNPVAVVTGDLNSTIISWNPQAEVLFGHKASEVIGKNLDNLVAPTKEMYEEAMGFVDHVLNVGLVHATTQRGRKDGTIVDVELFALPVIVGEEKVGFIAIYHDISELKKIERELRQQKEYYEALFINSPVAFVTADLDENIISWNPLAEELFGYRADEVIGKRLDDIVANDPAIREEAVNRSKQVIEEGQLQVTTKRTRKDGTLVDVELRGLPVIVGGEAAGFIGIYTDLTERIRTERELRKQKEYYESLFVNSPVAVVTADLDGIIISWNPEAEQLFGYREVEVLGLDLDDIVANHPSIRKEAETNTRQVLGVGDVKVRKTTKRTRKDGTFVEVELLALPVIVTDEKVGFIAIYYDISDLKNIERELRQQKEYYEALFINNPVAVVTTDMDINVVSWNPATERLFGYTEEEAIGTNLDDLVAKDPIVRTEAVKYSGELTSSKMDLVFLTTQRTRKDGSLVDVEAYGVPVFVGDQQVGFIALYYDITDLKNIERELRNQKAYFEATLENSPVAQMNSDLVENIVYWNKASELLFGYTKEEALGQKVDDLVARNEQIREEAKKYTEQLYKVGRVHLTSKRTRKDGTLVDVEASAAPVYVEGEVAGFTGAYHDIGPLLEARHQAEAANQAKSDFLARMSHELRTPMNAIIGFTRIVKRKGSEVLSEKQLDNLGKVLTSADHLLRLINDILDLSKIEAGRIDVVSKPFKIEPLMNLCLSTTQPLLQTREVRLEKEIEGPIETINSDEDKVKQILLNLLSNAAKFTHSGKITLSAASEEDFLVLSVSDTGIGILEESLQHIFEEFQQADAQTTRDYGGTGLGLTISQRLAHLMGGEITAESVEGEGSTFTLRLPMQYVEIPNLEDT
jgi:PAS domain S-box-containing protein